MVHKLELTGPWMDCILHNKEGTLYNFFSIFLKDMFSALAYESSWIVLEKRDFMFSLWHISQRIYVSRWEKQSETYGILWSMSGGRENSSCGISEDNIPEFIWGRREVFFVGMWSECMLNALCLDFPCYIEICLLIFNEESWCGSLV
jgi:hypothetical protein